jgi:hypothetical protein
MAMTRQIQMRLGADYELKIDQIAALRGGLKKVQVVRLAIDELHLKVFQRRSKDLVPPKVRPGRRRRTT